MVILFNLLFTHRGRTTLFWLGDSRIKLEAIMFGLVMGLLLVAIMFTFACIMILLQAINFYIYFLEFHRK